MAEACEVQEQVSNHPSICLLENEQHAVYPALPFPHRSNLASDLFMHHLTFLSLLWHFNFAFYLLTTAERMNPKCSSALHLTAKPPCTVSGSMSIPGGQQGAFPAVFSFSQHQKLYFWKAAPLFSCFYGMERWEVI